MRVRKLAALGAAFALSLVGIVAVAAPAQAVPSPVTVSASPSSFTQNALTQAFTVTVPSVGDSLATWAHVYVSLKSSANVGWPIAPGTCSGTASVTLADCNIASISIGGSVVNDAIVKKTSASSTTLDISRPSSAAFSSSTSNEVIVTFLAGAFTAPAAVGSGYNAIVAYSTTTPGVSITMGPISVIAPSSNATVTYDANGGTGSIAQQTASQATNLTANNGQITRSGYTFGGWADSLANANAGTVAYTDGQSYAFSSSITLYAIWHATNGSSNSSTTGATATSAALASTGANPAVPFGAAAALLLVGAAIALIRRRTAQ